MLLIQFQKKISSFLIYFRTCSDQNDLIQGFYNTFLTRAISTFLTYNFEALHILLEVFMVIPSSSYILFGCNQDQFLTRQLVSPKSLRLNFGAIKGLLLYLRLSFS